MKTAKTDDKIVDYTVYEAARIIGARALQVSMNAPILLKMSKQELEDMNYDSLKIAEREFRSGILPITVKRPYPIARKGESEKEESIEVDVGGKKEDVAIADIAPEIEGESESN